MNHCALLSPNKIIAKKTEERNKIYFERRMKGITCSIDRETPLSFRNMHNNPKKQQQHNEKMAEIERENKILLEKLTHIMHSPKSPTQREFKIKSLNKDLRKQELVRITIENQWMIKRISEKKSNYSRKEWNESRKKQEYYLKTMSQYPFKPLKSPTGSRDRFNTEFTDVPLLTSLTLIY